MLAHRGPWIGRGSDHQERAETDAMCASHSPPLCTSTLMLAIRLIVAMGAHMPPAQRSRRERVAAIDAVMSNPDLVSHILRSPIGPSTFVAASRVCKVWHAVCRSDEHALRRVSLYQGGLTRTALRGLFALTSAEAEMYPHNVHQRVGGGRYFVYQQCAIEQLLNDRGMIALQTRLQRQVAGRGPSRHTLVGPAGVLGQSKLEDRLHERAEMKARFGISLSV